MENNQTWERAKQVLKDEGIMVNEDPTVTVDDILYISSDDLTTKETLNDTFLRLSQYLVTVDVKRAKLDAAISDCEDTFSKLYRLIEDKTAKTKIDKQLYVRQNDERAEDLYRTIAVLKTAKAVLDALSTRLTGIYYAMKTFLEQLEEEKQ